MDHKYCHLFNLFNLFILFVFLLSGPLLSPSFLAADGISDDFTVKIPDCLLSYRFGPEQFALVVEKSTQSLFVYSNYKPEPVERFKITTGKNHGRKLVEGDKKTPVGIYFFRRTITGKDLPKSDDYGEKAFTMNYPNPIDRLEKRNGSGIWLHGAFDQNKTASPNNSRGCVVMKNDDLVSISKYVYLNKTPVIIYDKIKYDTVDNVVKRRERVIENIKSWKENWEDKNIDGYIAFYHPGFKSNGMDVSQFKQYKNRLNGRYKFIRVFLSGISLYAYENYNMVIFNQLYISDINDFYSQKIQYWKETGARAQIVDEYSFRLPGITKFESSKGNYVSIHSYRRDFFKRIKEKTVTLSPPQIQCRNISIFEENVKMDLSSPVRLKDIRVIPVLRLENGNGLGYRSLDGITLKDGVPQDFSGAVAFNGRQTSIVVKKEKDYELKSLTLFVLNNQNRYEQILTIYVNQ